MSNSLICLKTQAILLHAVFNDLDELVPPQVGAVVQLAVFGGVKLWHLLILLLPPLLIVAD